MVGKKTEPKKSIKIGRNEPCICDSGLKYKKNVVVNKIFIVQFMHIH